MGHCSDGPAQPSLTAPRYLTVGEVAELLHVSVDTVYRHIPCLRIGDSVRISPTALEAWIAAHSATSARRAAKSPFANNKPGLRSRPRANTRRRDTIE